MFPDASQGPVLKARTSKDSSLREVALALSCQLPYFSCFGSNDLFLSPEDIYDVCLLTSLILSFLPWKIGLETSYQ